MAQHAARSYTGAVLAGLTAAALLGGAVAATAAFADPITCPAGQVSAQVSPSEWQCVNGGGNQSNAEQPRSPQADKTTF